MEDAGEKAKNAEGDVDEQGAAAPVHDEDGERGEEEGGDEGDLFQNILKFIIFQNI